MKLRIIHDIKDAHKYHTWFPTVQWLVSVGKQAIRNDRCCYFLKTTIGLILKPAILKIR